MNASTANTIALIEEELSPIELMHSMVQAYSITHELEIACDDALASLPITSEEIE